jgi:hypothetical protein
VQFSAGFVSMWGNIPFVIRVIGPRRSRSRSSSSAAVTMMMAIRERTNEFALLKTLGFDDGGDLRSHACSRPACSRSPRGLAGSLLAKFLLEKSGLPLPGFSTMVVHWETVGFGAPAWPCSWASCRASSRPWQASRLRIVDALRKVG